VQSNRGQADQHCKRKRGQRRPGRTVRTNGCASVLHGDDRGVLMAVQVDALGGRAVRQRECERGNDRDQPEDETQTNHVPPDHSVGVREVHVDPDATCTSGRNGSRGCAPQRRHRFWCVNRPTVVEEINSLRQRGYTADFRVTNDGQLRCDPCGHSVEPKDAVIESTARFEGASNPDDQAIVFGLHCETCGLRGVLVAAYGPTATAQEATVLTTLTAQRRPGAG